MKIKELTLENFCCYYDINTFELSDGLNVILGHNGDGKSTIFTAFKWLFEPINNVKLEDLVSAKKFSDLIEGESANISITIIVEQYDERITIQKGFSVTNNSNEKLLSPVKETATIVNLKTGERDIDDDPRRLLNRIFPTEYRNFSMFETEAETLNLVNKSQLAKLVNSFSDASLYENMEERIASLYNKAEKSYISQSKADRKTQLQLEGLNNDIKSTEDEIRRLTQNIIDDEEGFKVYDETLQELARNSNLSKELNSVEERIKKVEEEKKEFQRFIKNKYTDYLFDEQFILAGYLKYSMEFSKKIDELRQERNFVYDEKIAEYAEEESRLALANGATPLPPGFPSEKVLNEFLKENICKVCGRPLDEIGRDYINKSLKIYIDNKKISVSGKKRYPEVFHNAFIQEMELLDKTLEIQNRKTPIERLKNDIEECIELNETLEAKVNKCNETLEELNKEKADILNQTTTSESALRDVLENASKIAKCMTDLQDKITQNKMLLEKEHTSLKDYVNRKRNIIKQLPASSFKEKTVEILEDIYSIFTKTKDREYDRFLSVLEEKATFFMKLINPNEVTGVIKLIRNGKEVSYISLNEDGSYRSKLDNSGALEISIPMSILFAIAELAAELRDESYPMIFDAPTGRFSEDRTLAFYNALYKTGKQRIIVTKEFLGVQQDGKPSLKNDLFAKVLRNKAFLISRERPFDLRKKETINTNIIEIN